MGMRLWVLVFGTVGFTSSLQAQGWQPSPGHTQVRIWPGKVPDGRVEKGPEVAIVSGKDLLMAGKPATGVGHVSQPTMTVYRPTSKNTGAAVVCFRVGATRS